LAVSSAGGAKRVAWSRIVALGIVLASKIIGPRWLVWLSLGLGLLDPWLCLSLGQRK